MEIYYFVLSCILFATTTSFSIQDASTEFEIDNNLSLDLQSCKCENGRCVTNKQGDTKCVCKPGFSLQEEFTCKPCDCGSLGKCIFILKLTGSKTSNKPEYQKKCVCDEGCAEKDGVCVKCDCGENSACDFDYGEKRCYCLDGYSEKNGGCTKCDCGFNGKCEFAKDNKKCQCDEGYLELKGMCEECDCGEHGTCSFENGQKRCMCQPGSSLNNGKCEKCDCGSNSKSCEFSNGVKRCICNDRYADRSGTCEECYCGVYSKSCSFIDNQKACNCLEGYVRKLETCELGCSTKNPCQNGGLCSKGLCFCHKGTRGEFCDEVEGCSDLCPRNQTDVKCSYDVSSKSAYCRCLDNSSKFHPYEKHCKRTCTKNDDCGKGLCFGDFCDCLPGNRGDRCESKDCSSGVIKCYGESHTVFYGHILWWGGDTLFLFRGPSVLRFKRLETDPNDLFKDCPNSSTVLCMSVFSLNWDGGDVLCIPWKQMLVFRFKRQDYKVDLQVEAQGMGMQ